VAGDGLGTGSGDGGPARAAALFQPAGLSVDSVGNIFISESGIREVSPSGTINSLVNGGFGFGGDGGPAIAGQLSHPNAVVSDAKGNLFIADQGNCRVRMVSTTGVISTVAGNGTCTNSGDGGLATAASFQNIQGLALDSTGAIYVADRGAQRVRKFTVGGNISTFAGTGVSGFSGDGGTA